MESKMLGISPLELLISGLIIGGLCVLALVVAVVLTIVTGKSRRKK